LCQQLYGINGCIVNQTRSVYDPGMTLAVPPPRLRPRDPRLGPWRAFLAAHARITRRLDEELRAEHDLSLGEYEALLSLAEAPERRLRMHALADRVVLSKSGVTRLIDRLVADGLVVRDQCLSDARGAEAVLTDDGLARLRRASGTHLRGIEGHFLAVVEDSDLPVVERAMRAVADRAFPGAADGPDCAPDEAPAEQTPGG
jgi:DNA-binding MarR family transcriptional regulator